MQPFWNNYYQSNIVIRGVKNNFNAVFCSLRNKKALGTFRTGGVETITINPYIIMRGKQVNATVADYFKESVWAKLPS